MKKIKDPVYVTDGRWSHVPAALSGGHGRRRLHVPGGRGGQQPAHRRRRRSGLLPIILWIFYVGVFDL